MEARLTELEGAVAALTERIERLESASAAPSRAGATGLDLLLLDRLAAATPDTPEGLVGACTYAGSLRVDGAPLVWQRNLSVPDVLAGPLDGHADVLSALGHPVRLVVLRTLCGGPTSAAALAEAVGASSPGMLYHHLDILQGAGLIRQVERGTWEVPPARVVPLVVLFGIAEELGAGLR